MIDSLIQHIVLLQMGQFQCQELVYSDNLRNIFALNPLQVTIIQSLGPVGIFFCIVNILMIILIKPLKQPPSDILIFISLLTLLKILLYFVTIIYNNQNPINNQIPQGFDNFCLTTGIIDVFCELSKLIATITFCLYYMTKIKNPLKAWVSEHKEIYFVSIFLISLGTWVLYYTGNIGISIYGYCSIKFSLFSQYIQLLFTFGFIVTLIVTSIIFLKYLQKISNKDLTFKKYFKYYFKFLISYCMNQLMVIFSHAVIAFTCSLDKGENIFNVCLVLDKIAIVINPIFIFVVLVNHPRFKKIVVIKILRALAKRCKLLSYVTSKQGESGYVEDNIVISTNKNQVLIQLNNLHGIDTGYVSQLKNKNRGSFLATILACLVIEDLQTEEMFTRQSAYQLQKRDSQVDYKPLLNFNQNSRIILNSQMVDFYHEIFLHKLPTINISLVSYCQTIFSFFKRTDQIQQIGKKLLPQSNQNQIIKDANSDGDGGRSGQFFFFNYDRSLILKTLNYKQKNIILSKLQNFYYHFLHEPKSFIVKIYSVFTAKNQSTQEETHFMLMGNILKTIDKHLVLKVYDLKGSSHHRQVLTNNACNDQIVVNTLKDLDFIKIQQKIWISNEDSNQVKQILVKDAQFLSSNKLIDYSLLVIKINYEELEAEDNTNKLRYFKSIKEPSIAYIFGIIDYLQTWNIMKKSQKWYKSIFVKSETISSQDPKFYFKRFTEHVINDFLP